MKPRPLTEKFNEFLTEGLAKNLFEAISIHKLQDFGNIQSLSPMSDIPMISSNGITALEYLKLLDENCYSAVFSDGSIVIVQTKFIDSKLDSHRYIYVPCPIDQEHISIRPADIPLADWIREVIDAEGLSSFKSTGYVRFDCVRGLVNTKDPHPVSHMTFSSGDCRVPVHSPLSISAFFNFLFDNFYRTNREFWLNYSSFLDCDGTEDTITSQEQMLHHIYCLPS